LASPIQPAYSVDKFDWNLRSTLSPERTSDGGSDVKGSVRPIGAVLSRQQPFGRPSCVACSLWAVLFCSGKRAIKIEDCLRWIFGFEGCVLGAGVACNKGSIVRCLACTDKQYLGTTG
jgi:hypothetical protein